MITIEQSGPKGIVMFGRDSQGRRTVERVNNFEPYFYDDNKKKIIATSSGDVKHMRRMFKQTFEADVNYCQRYLIDREKIPFGEEPLRICYFDIEVYLSLDTVNTPQPIIAITCYDNFLKKFVTFVWHNELQRKKKVGEKHSKFYFNDEESMLINFIDFIRDTDPDVIAGYNIYRYDFPYLINRCKRLNINIRKMSPMNYVDIQKTKYKDITVKGRVVFDLLRAYKKLKMVEVGSHKLLWIAKKEKLAVQKGKISIAKCWNKENIEKLIDYNKDDVEICRLLDEKRELINHHNRVRRFDGCPWDSTWFNSSLVDSVLLRESKNRNIILPTKIRHTKYTYEGAFVQKIISPGIHTGVFVLDLASMYPSIMQQFNMSFETLGGELKIGKIKLTNSKTKKVKIFDVSFKEEPEGMIPSIVKKLVGVRQYYKDEKNKHPVNSLEWKMHDGSQWAVKTIINSIYGALGYERFRCYKPEVAGAVTYIGRELIKWSMEQAKKLDFKVIYADTDSMFIETGLTDLEQISKLVVNLSEKVNASYNEFVKQFGCKENKHLKIDFERTFDNIYIAAKKRYVGRVVWEGGKKLDEPYVYTRGFEIRRSNFSEFGQKIQEHIFEMVLAGKGKEEVNKYVEEMKQKIKHMPIDEVAMPQTLKMDFGDYKTKGAHVRGAEYASQFLGENFLAGSKMKMVYVKFVKGKPPTDVICYSDTFPEEVMIDWDRMIQLIIGNKVDKIFESLGWVSRTESLLKWKK